MYKVEIENGIYASAIIGSPSDIDEYVLYRGDHEDYSALSPVTSMFLKIVAFYKSVNKRYLDMGVSPVNGNLDGGVFNFKSSLDDSDFSKFHFELLKYTLRNF